MFWQQLRLCVMEQSLSEDQDILLLLPLFHFLVLRVLLHHLLPLCFHLPCVLQQVLWTQAAPVHQALLMEQHPPEPVK